jgi:hypothetical protein
LQGIYPKNRDTVLENRQKKVLMRSEVCKMLDSGDLSLCFNPNYAAYSSDYGCRLVDGDEIDIIFKDVKNCRCTMRLTHFPEIFY